MTTADEQKAQANDEVNTESSKRIFYSNEICPVCVDIFMYICVHVCDLFVICF